MRGPPALGCVIRRYLDGDGSVWLELERTRDGYRLSFPGRADIGFEQLASRLTVHPAPGASGADVRHVLLDQVIPLLLVLEGLTVLHASAVAVGSGSGTHALLFAGASGAGKSTTAAACVLAGATLLADDFAVIDPTPPQPTLTPSGTGSRLWREVIDHMEPGASAGAVEGDEGKRRLAPAVRPPSLAAVPIGAIHLICERSGPATEPVVAPLGPGEACVALMHHCFRGALDDPQENRMFMDAAAQLVERVPVRRLTVPGRLDDLAEVGRQILQATAEATGAPVRPFAAPVGGP